MTNKTILTIDDDPVFLKLVDKVLTNEGYTVLQAGNGQVALRILFDIKPDLVLLDVVLPGMDGWQICSRIREVSDVPIIMITGKQKAEEDIERGLDFGADEYIIKPVGNRELTARVRAILRRAELPSSAAEKAETVYADDYLTIDIADRKITVRGERIRLTPREFGMLSLLVENAGRILTHRELLEKVWGWEYKDDLDYIRIYVSHLRQKIEPNRAEPRYILTEPGVGYYFYKDV